MIKELISQKIGISVKKVTSVANSAGHTYKDFYILKKDKTTKRAVSQPSRPVKSLQKLLNSEFLTKFSVHECATAYKNDTNIKKNAEKHLNNRYLLKLDFKNFFPSIKYNMIYNFLEKQTVFNLNTDDILFVCNLVCRNGGLVIGSPSSPIFSNIILYDFDQYVSAYMKKNSITYTRYADDMTFSSNVPNNLRGCASIIDLASKKFKLNLILNDKKTVYTSKKRLRKVTGIVLSSKNYLSVGRDRKRKVKSLFYKLIKNELNLKQIESLQGEIAYIASIESQFLVSLEKKYAEDFQQGMHKLKTAYLENIKKRE